MTHNNNLPATDKILYLDNLKVLLTILVIIHHAIITYGGPGSWYYSEPSDKMIPLIVMTMVVATNQAFFMGFFFFMSALFTESSYRKKGRPGFLWDRIKRLGIPLFFYSICLSPVLSYIVEVYGHDNIQTFGDYLYHYHNWVSFGVLWFVAALLLFTFVFAVTQNKNSTFKTIPFPSNAKIIGFAVLVGAISFIVRIFFPVGWTLDPLGFQLGHFPQYVVMFYIGIMATRSNWLSSMIYQQGKKLVVLPILMVVIGFPLIYFVKTITDSQLPTFSGGLHWQSLVYSLWEQITGISIMFSLLIIAKAKWNKTSPLKQSMSRSAFGVYIFHPLFLIVIAVLIKDIEIDKVLKLLFLIPTAVAASFIFVRGLLLVPGVNKII